MNSNFSNRTAARFTTRKTVRRGAVLFAASWRVSKPVRVAMHRGYFTVDPSNLSGKTARSQDGLVLLTILYSWAR